MHKRFLLYTLLYLIFHSFSFAQVDTHHKIKYLDSIYKKNIITETAYLDSVHVTMKNLLSNNIILSNKELLTLLHTFREVIWNREDNYMYKRTYYGILSNQAQMADREGEMLYYINKIQELEEEKTNQPSITSLSILTQYYNSKNASDYSIDLIKDKRAYIDSIPEYIKNGDFDDAQTVQATILLYNITLAYYLSNQIEQGYEIEKKIIDISEFVSEKYINDYEIIANILLRKHLAQYRRGYGLEDDMLINESFKNMYSLLNNPKVPQYLVRPLEATINEYKLDYFIQKQQVDSAIKYLKIYQQANNFLGIPYNVSILKKYHAQTLYIEGKYKESADTLLVALKNLDIARTNIVKDINDMMYAQAESEEKDILLSNAKSQQENSKYMLFSLGFGLFILTVFGVIFFKYFRRKQKEKFINFKLNLARSIHDEANPALLYAKTLLKNANKNDSEKSDLEKHIDYTMELIRSLSHDIKSDKQFTILDISDYIDSTLSKLKVAGIYTFEINKDFDDKRFISHYQYTQLIAIFNECISNSIKHAQFDKININIKQNNNKLIINYNDNGAGWNQKECHTGIGIQNINERIYHINAQLQLSNQYPKGYQYTFTIPLK